MARRKKGRAVNGILLLDKPYGFSSNQALQKVKWLFNAQKAGHTGALDPMATGVLPICLGEATKFSQFLLNADKSYCATIQFGRQTTTGDKEGEVLFENNGSHLDHASVQLQMANFLGEIEQVPPMYSALKVDGQPLYKLARQGIEVERKARTINIHEYQLKAFRAGEFPEADVFVSCSKGTYIRTLAEDLAKTLGDIGGHLIALERVQVGQFTNSRVATIECLQQYQQEGLYEKLDEWLISPEVAVNHLPLVEVTDSTGYYVRLGQAVFVPKSPSTGMVRIRQENGVFLGVGEMLSDGRVEPRRLIASNSHDSTG